MPPQPRHQRGGHSPAVRLECSEALYLEQAAMGEIPACPTEHCFGPVNCIAPSNAERYARTEFSHRATIVWQVDARSTVAETNSLREMEHAHVVLGFHRFRDLLVVISRLLEIYSRHWRPRQPHDS